MTPSLKISQKVIDRLSQIKCPSFGKVYGIVTKNSLIVLEIQLNSERNLINSLPAEIYLCGVINASDENYDEKSIKIKLEEVYVTDNPIFINYELIFNKITTKFYKNENLETTKFTSISEQEILSQFLHIRLTASVPLTCELSASSIKDCFTNLQKSVSSGVMTFGMTQENIFLLGGGNDNGVVGVSGNTTVGELNDEANEPSEGNTRKKKGQIFGIDVLEINMFKNMTSENGAIGTKEHAPVCVLDKKQCKTLNLMVPIDAISILHRDVKINTLYEIMVESAVRNIRLLQTAILDAEKYLDFSQPEIFHFYPENCGHFFTRIYFRADTEDSLLPERKQLHQELLLPEDRPMFRRANRFSFKTKTQMGEPLTNPHVGVKSTDNGGKVAVVRGTYTYYHYCQNKMDDNGWGCAYRSLQTLASWFKLQGYTNKEVPTFKDIQKCLVDIGDKPPSFIDSKQWIGSTEVNFVLNTLLGVTSKILYVSSGEEMASKGPELVSHFENHGSPVMIGGGVLAHTILGVDYNSQNGNLKFLILDPHYTGSEDLHIIQNKGWCGWKGVDFWDKTAYYNMCLPQVPKSI